MSVESRLKRVVLFFLPLLGVALGLFFVINGSLLGLIALFFGGALLIFIASGQFGGPQLTALRKSAADRRREAGTPEPTPASGDVVDDKVTTSDDIGTSPAILKPATEDALNRTPTTAATLITPASDQRSSRLNWLALGLTFGLGLALGVALDRLVLSPRPAPEANMTDANQFSPGDSPISPLTFPGSQAISDVINETIQVNNESVAVSYSSLDMGQVADIFDGRFETLIRGRGANPFIFEVHYPQTREASAVVLSLASMDNYEIKVIVTKTDGGSFTLLKEGVERLVDPSLEFVFPDGPHMIRSVRAEILDRRPPPQEGFHTHVRDFSLK